MSWNLRSPQSFPAHFSRIMLEAVAHEGRSVLFGSYRDHANAKHVAQQFRHFRWCIRQQPEIVPKLAVLETTFDFRLSSEEEYINLERWLVLYLTAQPTKLSQFVNLNPHLVPLILSEGA